MSFYFVCPGDATVSATTVQCSQTITTVDTPSDAGLTLEQKQDCINSVWMIIATVICAYLIKKAIDV